MIRSGYDILIRVVYTICLYMILIRIVFTNCLYEFDTNRPFTYSTKEPGSSVIFIHFYTRGSSEWS